MPFKTTDFLLVLTAQLEREVKSCEYLRRHTLTHTDEYWLARIEGVKYALREVEILKKNIGEEL